MTAGLRVAVDVGSRFHQVAVGTVGGELVDEFRIDHRSSGFSRFFDRIERHGAVDVGVAMEGYNGWAWPLVHTRDSSVWSALKRGRKLYPTPFSRHFPRAPRVDG